MQEKEIFPTLKFKVKVGFFTCILHENEGVEFIYDISTLYVIYLLLDLTWKFYFSHSRPFIT